MDQHATARILAERALEAVRRKDLPALLALWDDDGEFVDPHFPEPRMRGRAAIERGHRWAFGVLRAYGFTVRTWFDGPDDTSGAVEVWTHHTLPTGRKLEFEQVFIVESRAGRLTRLQSFVPYGPPGAAGLALRLARLARRGR